MSTRWPPVPALVVVAAVVLTTSICLWNGAQRIGQPFPGFLVAENRTVFSIGRSGWSIEAVPRAFFSQVIGVEGHPVKNADEIMAAASMLSPGSEVAYRFRKGAEIFSGSVVVQRFTAGDFFAVYGTYALVGLAFSLCGLWAVVRYRGGRPMPPALTAFFILCQCVGFALGSAGDVYGPYWLVPLYFTTQCATFASLIHLAISFPQPLGIGSRWRSIAIALLYASAMALALGLTWSGDDVSLFVPLLYVVYLLLANAIFLYLAALASGLSIAQDAETRTRIWRAIAGILAVVVLPAMIFLIYPILQQSISPLTLVGPLILFPLLTVWALPTQASVETERASTSVRFRLSLLFLGAVETSFLIAVAVFWQSNSWAQMLDDLLLNERRRASVQQSLALGALEAASFAPLEDLAQTVREQGLVRSAREATARGDAGAAKRNLEKVLVLYEADAARLDARRQWIGALAVPVLVLLLSIAVLQAVAFTIAVRRWIVGPLDRVGRATSVIATGDLAHRLEPEQGDEFARLGGSVNTMAASLQAIQRRVELARAARQRAAGAARESERRRLARELHDGILQDLSAVRLTLEKEKLEQPSVATKNPAETISGVIAAIRGVVDDLRPPALSSTSLADAIAGHARVLAWSRGVELTLDLEGSRSVAEWATRDLYRIAQEAIANALRHSGAKHIAIRLAVTDAETILEIEDDGIGFDPESSALGSGIQGMRERAAVLGSDLEIGKGLNGGAWVRVVLRVQPDPATTGED